jgi:hypothetical protein
LQTLKNITMKKSELKPSHQKIIDGMDKVYEKLIEFKKKMNSELVVMKDDKIVRIKP